MRQLVISEEFGVYKASTPPTVSVTGRTPEDALVRLSKILGHGEPEIHNRADVGEWIEQILGPVREL